jgi:hypothetical protein
MSTYQKIRSLAKQLLEEKAVKERRLAGAELEKLLASANNRRKLVSEVTPPPHKRGRVSINVAQRNALAEVWRFIIQNALLASRKIVFATTKKVKVTAAQRPGRALSLLVPVS